MQFLYFLYNDFCTVLNLFSQDSGKFYNFVSKHILPDVYKHILPDYETCLYKTIKVKFLAVIHLANSFSLKYTLVYSIRVSNQVLIFYM